MRTKIQQDSPVILRIPETIRQDILSRGFHLYKWISPDEVKLSIERDFLKTLSYVGAPIAVISILFSLPFYQSIILLLGVFLGIVSIGIFGIFLYLFFLSLKRSYLLSKNAFVVITDSSISLGGKIVQLSELSQIESELSEVGEAFEEPLFEKSNLDQTKKGLTKEVLEQLYGGYKLIFENGHKRYRISSDNDNEKFLLLIIILYTLYAILMSGVYFVGVFFLWIFGTVMTKINTWILIRSGQQVLKINSLFSDIDIASESINDQRLNMENLLEEARNNNWQDGLLTKINEGFEQIHFNAEKTIISVVNLRDEIKKSKYKKMFSFDIYNQWVKNQVSSPLENIIQLLETSKTRLLEAKEHLEDEVKKNPQIDLSGNMILQAQRLRMQVDQIDSQIQLFQAAITKLQS